MYTACACHLRVRPAHSHQLLLQVPWMCAPRHSHQLLLLLSGASIKSALLCLCTILSLPHWSLLGVWHHLVTQCSGCTIVGKRVTEEVQKPALSF